jgi:RNA ligase/PHA02142 OB-fold domain
MEKKSNHQVNVVRLGEPRVHTNADSLELFDIGGYQVVTKKGQFKAGDLGVYIQPDSVVPQTEPFKFIWESYQTDPAGVVPERRRRVTVRKFRGEWSEGLLMPASDFKDELQHIDWNEGTDVSGTLGITHYDPDKGRESTATGDVISGPHRRFPRTFKGWLFFLLHKLGFKRAGRHVTEDVGFHVPVYDVEAFKNYRNAFILGEPVVVTEKIHGSNARFLFLDGKMYAGSRTLWKAPKSNCVWRKALAQNPWIEEWCRAHEGYTLYGEVTLTQKGFDYGCKEGEVKFFVFDILTPEGEWVQWKPSWPETFEMLQGLTIVPVLYTGPFDLDKINPVVNGASTVAVAKHIREGAVIKPVVERHVRGLGRLQLKIISNAYLERDSK